MAALRAPAARADLHRISSVSRAAAFLNERYLPSRTGAGLWIKRDDFGRFETTRWKTSPRLTGRQVLRIGCGLAPRSRTDSDLGDRP